MKTLIVPLVLGLLLVLVACGSAVVSWFMAFGPRRAQPTRS